MNFWNKLKKPIMVLAPMADVTDIAFRTIIAKYGKPDVMWSEFVSADGLMKAPDDNHDNSGLSSNQKLMKDLEYTDAERPIVAQLFSGNPEMMEQAAALVQKIGFDGIDINMGCPDKSIERQKAGASLMRDYKLARELVKACKRGAPKLPVSVKTRTGYNSDQLEEWLRELLKENPATVTIHARTRKEMSKVPANWERIKRAVEIRDELKSETLIIGNGDVTNLEEAEARVKESRCDGVMIGRGIFGNPWLFNKKINREDVSIKERLEVMLEHTKLFEEKLPHKSFAVMKKHYKAYVDGFDGAKELRVRLMESQNSGEVQDIVKEFIKNV
ncbi:MAG: nifR3 family TIM-barrel protein [Candidatus Paceibacteria bacterium]|jgi:nifR3 family TIM-barrel protein